MNKNDWIAGDSLSPEVKRQVDMIETIIKSRVAIGAQVSRSRVVNSLRESVCELVYFLIYRVIHHILFIVL